MKHTNLSLFQWLKNTIPIANEPIAYIPKLKEDSLTEYHKFWLGLSDISIESTPN